MVHSVQRVARLSDWHRIKRLHAPGAEVEARVARVYPFGAVCSIGQNAAMAVLRKIEISWDPKEQVPDRLQEGFSFKAVVLGYDDDRRQLIISRKAAETTPFTRFRQAHRIGETVEATVERLAPKVVVVRLTGGVEGEIPWDSVPKIPRRHPQMTADWELNIGDYVKASVEEFCPDTRTVRLSLLNAFRDHQGETRKWLDSVRTKNSQPVLSTLANPLGNHATDSLPAHTGRLRILIVENENDILAPLAATLRDRCHRVITATNGAQASRAIAASDGLDVAVVDLQLRGESGLPLLANIRDAFPGTRLVVFSGNLEIAEHDSIGENMTVVVKPVDVSELIEVIEGRRSGHVAERLWGIDEAVEMLSSLDHRSVSSLEAWTLRVIDDYLLSLAEPFEKATAAILTYSKAANKVRCLRALGVNAGSFDRFDSNLMYSFVGDVLRGETLGLASREKHRPHADDSRPSPLDRLLEDLDADHVCGVPLQLELQDDAVGAFVFLPEGSDSPSTSVFREFRHQAASMALAIERAAWDASLVHHQRALSAGSLLLGMTHELRNAVTALKIEAFRLEELLRQGRLRSRNPEPFSRCLNGFKHQLSYLANSFESLMGLSRTRREHHRPLAQVLIDVLEQCRPSAERDNVTLVFDNLASDAVAQATVSMAVFQVVMNLVLNGMQHAGVFQKEDGFVHVTLDGRSEPGTRVAEIRVRDNAFGIEWENRERIFRKFHTTRRDGSGLGLYVARLIAQSLGGSIEVESSHKYFGTTMLVRLPLGGDTP